MKSVGFSFQQVLKSRKGEQSIPNLVGLGGVSWHCPKLMWHSPKTQEVFLFSSLLDRFERNLNFSPEGQLGITQKSLILQIFQFSLDFVSVSKFFVCFS